MKAKFIGGSNDQVKWGRGGDPRPVLKIGQIYTITDMETHSWHTLFFIDGHVRGFNSVLFEVI